jgi:hypothetical protein
MPKFINRDNKTGKKRSPQIGIIVSDELKESLEILAQYNKRKLSDFCRIELEAIVQKEENKEIIKKYKKNKEN